MTVRIDPATRLRLRALARRHRRTTSDLARTAIEAWMDHAEALAGASPYEALQDLLGCVTGGDPGRSSRGAAWITAELRRKTRKRTPRST